MYSANLAPVVMWDWCGTLFCEGKPAEHVEAVLGKWSDARHAILTNARSEDVLYEINRLGWLKYFQRVQGGEVARKPDPQAIHQLLHSLDASDASAIMIGDQDSDAQCAVRAGYAYVLLDRHTTLRELSRMTLDELFAQSQHTVAQKRR